MSIVPTIFMSVMQQFESKINWGAESPSARGPILPRVHRHMNDGAYNALGLPGGLWGFHGQIAGVFINTNLGNVPTFEHTESHVALPEMTAVDHQKVVTLDPYGWDIRTHYLDWIYAGYRLSPTGAVNRKLTFNNPFITASLNDAQGDLRADGFILMPDGDFHVTQITMDQTWYLPGVAAKIQMPEEELRRKIFEVLGEEMFPQLINDEKIQVLLPPIGGISVRIFGDIQRLGLSDVFKTVRLHDFCHDGDAGACLCSCCVYRNFAIKKCIQTAQNGGVGITIEGMDEGTGYGSVAKHTIYNGRLNHPDGDVDDHYFNFRRMLTGGDDGRMPWTKLAILHILGIRHIDEWISMSEDKRRDVEVKEGVTIGKQIDLPKELRRSSFDVELSAKKKKNGIPPG